MTNLSKRATVMTTWDVWTYDVWGNAKDGYDVNDRFNLGRDVTLRLKKETFNAGTERAFVAASPSDYQLQRLFGVRCQLETDGDDCSIYVRRAKDGYPIGELDCTSHSSLSPVKHD